MFWTLKINISLFELFITAELKFQDLGIYWYPQRARISLLDMWPWL